MLKCAKRLCSTCGVHCLVNDIKESNNLDTLQQDYKWYRWENDTVKMKDKIVNKVAKVEKPGNGFKLLNGFLAGISNLAGHFFHSRWQMNDCQQCVKNNEEGQVIIVHDFSQNYTCAVQDEVQSGNLDRNLATVHPSVIYFKCTEGCKQTVTLEYIHISSDLKHDQFAVNRLQSNCLEELRRLKVSVKKLIEFMDQAPTQYKNKNVFHHLSMMNIPVVRNYYAVHHGKCVADGAGGRTKCAAWSAALANKVQISNAKFFEFCKSELETPDSQSNQCQHFGVKYRFLGEFKRPKVNHPTITIAQTREVHSVRNTGYPGVVEVRNVSCNCSDCLTTGKLCINHEYLDEWKCYPCSRSAESKEPSGPNLLWPSTQPETLHFADPPANDDDTLTEFLCEDDFIPCTSIRQESSVRKNANTVEDLDDMQVKRNRRCSITI